MITSERGPIGRYKANRGALQVIFHSTLWSVFSLARLCHYGKEFTVSELTSGEFWSPLNNEPRTVVDVFRDPGSTKVQERIVFVSIPLCGSHYTSFRFIFTFSHFVRLYGQWTSWRGFCIQGYSRYSLYISKESRNLSSWLHFHWGFYLRYEYTEENTCAWSIRSHIQRVGRERQLSVAESCPRILASNWDTNTGEQCNALGDGSDAYHNLIGHRILSDGTLKQYH